MRYSIRTALVVMLAVALATVVWKRYADHRKLWSGYTENSQSKAELAQVARFYVSSFPYINDLDPQWVDFRGWTDGGGCAKFWTCWRTPYSEAALRAHLEQYEYVACPRTEIVIGVLENNLPADWDFNAESQLDIYCPDWQKNNGNYYFCSFIVVDKDARIIYFYDQDQEVPA